MADDGVQEVSASGLAFRRSGHGGRVVLVHGIPGSAQAWDPVVDALAGRFDVVVPDLLGFGASAGPTTFDIDTLGPAAQSAALEGLLDELGGGPWVLVGHDFGAPVSILLARRRPDLASAVLFLAGNAFPDTPIPFPLSLVTMPVVGPLAGPALFSAPALTVMLRRGVGAGGPRLDPGVYLGGARQRRAVATIFAGALRSLAALYAPVERALREAPVPVAVGWGDEDPFFTLSHAERTAAAAGAPLRVFGGAGHFLPAERPAEVAAEIESLAARVHAR